MAQSAQSTCGIARDHRILVCECPSQRLLNPCRLGCQVNQGINGVAPHGDPLIPKQVHQQGNGRRTDPPDDFKSHHMQVFIPRAEESSQQGQRTRRRLDQSGFGSRPDLRLSRHQAICPVTHRGGVRGQNPNPGLGAAEGVNAWFGRVLVSAEYRTA